MSRLLEDDLLENSGEVKKEKQKFTNLIIIDASGSMYRKSQTVIDGLKELFKQIKKDIKENPNVLHTTIVIDFDTEFNVLINSTKASDLTDKVAESYQTRGGTALLDAIGKGISMVPKDQNGVFVNILTDGEENSSYEYSNSDIQDLIEKKKKNEWAFTFMGTTQEAIKEAKSWGISAGNTLAFADNERGIKMSMDRSNLSRTAYYAASNTSGITGQSISAVMDLDNIVSDSANTTIDVTDGTPEDTEESNP